MTLECEVELEVGAWFWTGVHVLRFFMALCSFAVPRAMVGNGCMQRFGQESDAWGTGLLQVFWEHQF